MENILWFLLGFATALFLLVLWYYITTRLSK